MVVMSVSHFKYITLILLGTFVVNSHGHSGALNAEGCHNNKKIGEYHCHSKNSKKVESPSAIDPDAFYSREQFGRGWGDLDDDCQNSRQETLITLSTTPVRFKDYRNCSVISGRWISPFTGRILLDASLIDIDHIVPLKWAWDHGANQWTSTQRKSFANDPVNLWPVERELNRQKGANGLEAWMPPSGQCEYASRFIRVARKYNLELPKLYKAIHESSCK